MIDICKVSITGNIKDFKHRDRRIIIQILKNQNKMFREINEITHNLKNKNYLETIEALVQKIMLQVTLLESQARLLKFQVTSQEQHKHNNNEHQSNQ